MVYELVLFLGYVTFKGDTAFSAFSFLNCRSTYLYNNQRNKMMLDSCSSVSNKTEIAFSGTHRTFIF